MVCEPTPDGLVPIPACFGASIEEAMAAAVEETGVPWSELESEGLVVRRMRISLELGWGPLHPSKRRKQREKGKKTIGRRVRSKGKAK